MKKIIIATLCASMLCLTACGKSLTVKTDHGSKTYETYGLLNQNSAKSDKVCYELSVGNTIWSVILIQTVVFPVYFAGFSIFNPVRLKDGPNDDCQSH